MLNLAPIEWPIIDEPIRRAVAEVLRKGVLSGSDGIEVRALEEDLAEWLGVPYVVCTSSGTAALQTVLSALALPTNSEVLIPCYTFGATALAVIAAGLRPRFVAIDPSTWNMDPTAAAQAVSPRTSAILAVHMHGLPFDVDALTELANRNKLLLIEDAAQAHGATWHGRACGSLAHAGCFSLQSSKHIGVGEGGFVATSDPNLASIVRNISGFGMRSGPPLLDKGRIRYREHERIGGNHRLNEIAAAMARIQLARLPERLQQLRHSVDRLFAKLATLDGLILPAVQAHSDHAWHKIRLGIASELIPPGVAPSTVVSSLCDLLAKRGIETTFWQTPILPLHPAFESYAENERWETSDSQDALDRSFILFHETRPLIAQIPETVDQLASAFSAAWGDFERFLGDMQ